MKLPDKQNIQNDFFALYQLTRRDMKIFLKDKAAVFFSLLAPLIVLLLYVLFLGDIQVDSVKSFMPEGLPVDEKLIKAYVDSWMVAGVLGVAVITVSFSANSIMVVDKTKGFLNDCLAAPIKKWIITISYFIFNFLVTVIICLIVFAVCLIYLVIRGTWCWSAGDIFGIIGTILFASLSSTLITVFICGFFKTEAQHGAIVGIASAVIGFLIGAYMPMSVMPKFAQYISCLIPGSHGAGMFRNFLMSGALEKLSSDLPAAAVTGLKEAFVMEVDMFGTPVGLDIMAVYLLGSIIVFLALNLAMSYRKKLK